MTDDPNDAYEVAPIPPGELMHWLVAMRSQWRTAMDRA